MNIQFPASKVTREMLRQVAFNATPNRALHDDLIQEAFIHVWLRETQCPGQTQSWYVQSCRFFLKNLLRNGRSVYSNRHHRALCSTAAVDECVEASANASESDGSVRALVSAREMISLLAKVLTPFERQVLSLLAEGFGVRELAAQLNVSHTSVIRCRRRIAAQALKLGIEPLPHTNGRRPRSGTGSVNPIAEMTRPKPAISPSLIEG